ncbi:MAG: GNAT family N-acetyltransferase [Candidatus Woesearchaeota archaeon]|nr:GNAT family N-acetyltransferase [Candidatus Woesearchaeota archaeon]
MKISKLGSSSWKDYRDLRLEALKSCPIMFGSSYDDEKKLTKKDWESRLSSKLSETLCCIDENDSLVGMITALYNPKKTQKHIAMIVSFYVVERYRGQGIGKRLFLALIKRIRQKRHIRKIKIQAAKINSAAIGMYLKFGFQKVGMLKKEVMVDRKYYDDVIMERLL